MKKIHRAPLALSNQGDKHLRATSFSVSLSDLSHLVSDTSKTIAKYRLRKKERWRRKKETKIGCHARAAKSIQRCSGSKRGIFPIFYRKWSGEKTLWIWRGLIELGTLIGAIRRTNSGVGPRLLFFSSSPSFGRSLFLLNDKLPHFGMVEVEIYNRDKIQIELHLLRDVFFLPV